MSTSHGAGSRGSASEQVWTVPNALSMFRLALVPVFLWLLLSHRDGWAVVTLAVSGISDYLDGLIARRYGLITRLGQVLDPIADRLYLATAIVGLAVRGILPWWFVAALVARDLVGTGLVVLVRTVGYRGLPVHAAGKAATFCLLYAMPLIVLGEWDNTGGTIARSLGWAFAWWGLGLYWFGVAVYAAQAQRLVRLVRLEPAAESPVRGAQRC